MTVRELHTEIEIDAPPEAVWAVLTDLPALGSWNPFVRAIDAPAGLTVGERIRVTLRSPGGRETTFRPRLLAVEPARELRWLGHVGIPGIFDGEHRFELSATASGGTRLVHAERFRGVLVGLVWRKVGPDTTAGFDAMNRALAERVHARPLPRHGA